MSITFNCPKCHAHIQAGEEVAGQMGQCPRCEHVFEIPSPNKPAPGRPPAATQSERVPPSDPWGASQAPRIRDDEPPRRRRRQPSQPQGPAWPWVLGIASAVAVGVLLFASFLVLVSMRRPEPPLFPVEAPGPMRGNVNGGNTVGRLEGRRAILDRGVFQVRAALTPDDPFDQDQRDCKNKRFEVELQQGRDYVLELDSNHFDGEIRLTAPNNVALVIGDGRRGLRSARVDFRPQQTQLFAIHVTSLDPAFGEFTLTVRERHLPKPMLP